MFISKTDADEAFPVVGFSPFAAVSIGGLIISLGNQCRTIMSSACILPYMHVHAVENR
jgi:hypothetical protein